MSTKAAILIFVIVPLPLWMWLWYMLFSSLWWEFRQAERIKRIQRMLSRRGVNPE